MRSISFFNLLATVSFALVASASPIFPRATPAFSLTTTLNNTVTAYQTMVQTSNNILFSTPFDVIVDFPEGVQSWNDIQLQSLPVVISPTVDATTLANLSSGFVSTMGQILSATSQSSRVSLATNFLNTLSQTQLTYKSNFTSYLSLANTVVGNYINVINQNNLTANDAAFVSSINAFNQTIIASNSASATSLVAFLNEMEQDMTAIEIWALVDTNGGTSDMPAVLKTYKTTNASHYTDDATTLNNWSLSTWTWIEEQI